MPKETTAATMLYVREYIHGAYLCTCTCPYVAILRIKFLLVRLLRQMEAQWSPSSPTKTALAMVAANASSTQNLKDQ